MSCFGEVDSTRRGLIMLSYLVLGLSVLGRVGVLADNKRPSFFSFLFLALIGALLLVFYTDNFLVFYVMFECRVIPVLFLILG